MKRLRCLGMVFLVNGALLGTGHAQSGSAALPLADLHFHADKNLSPADVLATMDRAGVRWAGAGPKGADTFWQPYVAAAPDRFLPFGGQGAIGTRVQAQGEAAWTLKSPELERYLPILEQGLRGGRLRGIGELFVNNQYSHAAGFQQTRYPADSPLVQRLAGFSATYRVPLSIHMEAEADSVRQLESLLDANPNAVVIWAHCGFTIAPDQLQALMDKFPNLLCELSHRDDSWHAPGMRTSPITGAGRQLKTDWKAILEKHSDRFLIGTDVDDFRQYPSIIDFYRAVLAQLTPEAAKQLAYGNAARLFRLSP